MPVSIDLHIHNVVSVEQTFTHWPKDVGSTEDYYNSKILITTEEGQELEIACYGNTQKELETQINPIAEEISNDYK